MIRLFLVLILFPCMGLTNDLDSEVYKEGRFYSPTQGVSQEENPLQEDSKKRLNNRWRINYGLTESRISEALISFIIKGSPFPRLDPMSFSTIAKYFSPLRWINGAYVYFKFKNNPCEITNFLESSSHIKPKFKIEVMKTLLRKSNQKQYWIQYFFNMLSKDELVFDEIDLFLPILPLSSLSADNWLILIDHILAMPALAQEWISDPESPQTVSNKKKEWDENTCFMLCPELCDGILVGDNMRELNNAVSYLLYSNAVSWELIKVRRPFKIDMAILHHLFLRFPDRKGLRNHILGLWVKRTTPRYLAISGSQISSLTQHALITTNRVLAEYLLRRGSFLSTPVSYKNPQIAFVASEEPRGDGTNPETMDYFMNKPWPQLSLVIPQLHKHGFDVKVLSWQDKTVAWQNYDVLFIGTVWGYTEHRNDFNRWLRKIKHLNIPLVNSWKFIQWNLSKTYLIDLQDAKMPVIPSFSVPKNSIFTLKNILTITQSLWKTNDIILKGIQDAGGFGYHHLKEDYTEEDYHKAKQHLAKLKEENQGAIVQPFWPEVYNKGEISFVFFGGALSHSYLKVCAPAKELVQEFYGGQGFHIKKEDLSTHIDNFLAKIKVFRPDIQITRHELEAAHAQIYPLYYNLKAYLEKRGIIPPPVVRLDGVIRNHQLHLMEVEGIEPYLQIQEASNYDAEKRIIEWYIDAIIRQLSINGWKK